MFTDQMPPPTRGSDAPEPSSFASNSTGGSRKSGANQVSMWRLPPKQVQVLFKMQVGDPDEELGAALAAARRSGSRPDGTSNRRREPGQRGVLARPSSRRPPAAIGLCCARGTGSRNTPVDARLPTRSGLPAVREHAASHRPHAPRARQHLLLRAVEVDKHSSDELRITVTCFTFSFYKFLARYTMLLMICCCFLSNFRSRRFDKIPILTILPLTSSSLFGISGQSLFFSSSWGLVSTSHIHL